MIVVRRKGKVLFAAEASAVQKAKYGFLLLRHFNENRRISLEIRLQIRDLLSKLKNLDVRL